MEKVASNHGKVRETKQDALLAKMAAEEDNRDQETAVSSDEAGYLPEKRSRKLPKDLLDSRKRRVRQPLTVTLHPEVKRAIEKEMDRVGITASRLIEAMAVDYLNVDEKVFIR